METPYSNPRIPNTRNLQADTINVSGDASLNKVTAYNIGLGGRTPEFIGDMHCIRAVPTQIRGSSTRLEVVNSDNSAYTQIQENMTHTALSHHWETYGTPNPIEKLTLTNDGKLGIGDTTPNQKLQVAGSAYIDTDIHVNNYIRPGSNNHIKWLASDNGGIHQWYFDWYSNPHAQVEFRNLGGANNCTIKAKAYQNISDDRVKTNETPILNATDTLKKLNPVTYDYFGNLDCSGVSSLSAGLVGQSVWYNAPELRFIINPALDASLNHDISSNDDWGTDALGINYTELIPYLIKSIQELEARISALEN